MAWKSVQICFWSIALAFQAVTGFILANGPTCYQCDATFSPESCLQTHTCSSDQECYTERLFTPDNSTVYRLGCISRHACGISAHPGNGTLCFDCCSDDTCNRGLCDIDSCPPLHYGPICTETCGHCKHSAQCDKVTGRCEHGCAEGYLQPFCKVHQSQICPSGKFGSFCTEDCGSCTNGEQCEKTTGRCNHGCEDGFIAPFCQSACPSPWYGSGCSNLCGRCLRGERCDHRNGTCTNGCETGFTPPKCSEELAIRLVNGTSPSEGRLEIFHDNSWGTVCSNGFNTSEAVVACRELGMTSTGARVSTKDYGQGSNKIWLNEVACDGDEETLADCGHLGWGVNHCRHSQDVGIRCDDFSIRLVHGSSTREGRLEVHHEGQWGTVCDDHFDALAAKVVCRMLGFGGIAISKPQAFFGQGRGRIWLDEVRCSGHEANILDCAHAPWGATDCQHTEDVGVICSH